MLELVAFDELGDDTAIVFRLCRFVPNGVMSKERSLRTVVTSSACDVGVVSSMLPRETAREVSSFFCQNRWTIGMIRRGEGPQRSKV